MDTIVLYAIQEALFAQDNEQEEKQRSRREMKSKTSVHDQKYQTPKQALI